jgi:hypothetical protein
MMMFQFVVCGKKISILKKCLVRSSDEKTSYPATWGSAKDAYIRGGALPPCQGPTGVAMSRRVSK